MPDRRISHSLKDAVANALPYILIGGFYLNSKTVGLDVWKCMGVKRRADLNFLASRDSV
jgi:hypothetical protein